MSNQGAAGAGVAFMILLGGLVGLSDRSDRVVTETQVCTVTEVTNRALRRSHTDVKNSNCENMFLTKEMGEELEVGKTYEFEVKGAGGMGITEIISFKSFK